jgi:hypothetical protein
MCCSPRSGNRASNRRRLACDLLSLAGQRRRRRRGRYVSHAGLTIEVWDSAYGDRGNQICRALDYWVSGCGPVPLLDGSVQCQLPSSSAPPATIPTVVPTAAPTSNAGITVSGPGQQTSSPFTLAAGNYQVHYKFGGDCFYSGELKSIDGSVDKFNFVTGSSATEGDTNLYGLPADPYYLDMTTGPAPSCPWTITFKLAG